MSTKNAPCTIGPRHKWVWVKNVNVWRFKVTAFGKHGCFSLRGLYECQCGQRKHGLFDPNGTDLRNIAGVQS